ncbi:ABC transporter permease [Pseudoxanthobacter sp.]|uniref:ABC transporter permease n=1 Tax=Pseudoxanthobacter sp. TaxID=1925742 RepID=UPI002FE26051
MSLRPTSRDWRLAAIDLRRGFAAWQIWFLLGMSDIRQRYKRSRFGQFWITFSMAIFIGGIGLVYSQLFNTAIDTYVPYLAVSYTVWVLISGIITESTTAFSSSAVYLRQDALPKTIFILRVLVRNSISFLHNVVLVPLVFLIFQVNPGFTWLLAFPGLVLLLAAAFLLALLLGVLSTRFRDLPQIVQNLVQMMFFVTPVMWQPDQMGRHMWLVVDFNPAAIFLRLVTEPMSGHVPPLSLYGYALAIIAVLAALVAPLFARFRARIVYWL